MGKKKILKLPSLFRPIKESTKSSSYPWSYFPSCNHPKTLSFRAGDDIFKTVNSIFLDTIDNSSSTNVQTAESWFTNSSESASISTESDDIYFDIIKDHKSLETVVRGVVRSETERLFFEPGGDTSSILEKKTTTKTKGEAKNGFFSESVVLAMESEDPYGDFRRSMEEMVESCGLKDWDCLEELLSWYLRVNGKKNHGFIVGAFVDLLVSLAADPSASTTTCFCCSDSSTCYSSAVSSFASSPLCDSLTSGCHVIDHQ
ncbi:transcription repressor OFP13-like [Quillaja saponaria]|uniref:Transcription repressor n=1 Tax=Quillaja saponaria TaxID=32244 RepID=A0AAD7PWW4_QUISA|nr:transcription repressor OFP13-like [Quillaja saponaria]